MKAHVKLTNYGQVDCDTPLDRWLAGKALDPRWSHADTETIVDTPVEYWDNGGFLTDIESLDILKVWAEEADHRFFAVYIESGRESIYNYGQDVTVEIYNYYRE